ncbi:MAG: carbamoyltransferase HypF [Bacillota bacterium]
MKIQKAAIDLHGVVQGVGFRPFVQRLAARLGLTGRVENREYGVHLEVYGKAEALARFSSLLTTAPPPAARIFRVVQTISEVPMAEAPRAFLINKSAKYGEITAFIPPDLALCPACQEELTDPGNRRYRHPFITCNDCGPRFSVVKALPYDRQHTSMAVFPLCGDCRREYEDLENRRCHAQLISCHADGPVLSFWDGHQRVTGNGPALQAAVRRLKEGQIVAVKGLGGFHLACRPENEAAVARLRAFKHRPTKPLALMARDLETITRYAHIGPEEKTLLTGPEKPIVILEKRDPSLFPAVAPGLATLGFMLPYTPLHYLLLEEIPVLVMTSGNIEGEAICRDEEEARRDLSPLTPYFLLHDREIVNRCDDSLVAVTGGRPVILRRARGYTPRPVCLWERRAPQVVLATGADLKGCFGLARGEYVFLGPYLGDLERVSTGDFFRESLHWFETVFDLRPGLVVSDLHPGYFSTRYGEELARKRGLPWYRIQHHHAHVYSVMAEHGLETAVGVALDGTGYGEDGRAWGGEFFFCRQGEMKRLAHLDYIPLLGGEKAIREPARVALVYLARVFGPEYALAWYPDGEEEASLLLTLLAGEEDLPLTSSMGRLFDAVSALLDVCRRPTYEGEAAVLLEARAEKGVTGRYPWHLDLSRLPWRIKVEPMVAAMVEDLAKGRPVAEIAGRFHNTMAEVIIEVAARIAEEEKEVHICLSGGVFQNRLLTEAVLTGLARRGLRPLLNQEVPPNDGGIALGQIYGWLLRMG